MHFQHRNPSHDRSHRISLMPLATNAQGSSYVRQIIGPPMVERPVFTARGFIGGVLTAMSFAALLYVAAVML